MTKRPLRSLRNSDGFKQFVLDQLDALNVTGRSMFGGCGLYRGDAFFGIIASDVLYFKVDDTNRRDYEDAGMKPFKPYADRSGTMKYYAVLCRWSKAGRNWRNGPARPSKSRSARSRRSSVVVQRVSADRSGAVRVQPSRRADGIQ